MLAASVAVEVEVVAAVNTAQTLVLVLDGVAVHYVHDHGDAERMGLVYQALQVVGRAETAGGGVEAADMIAERAIIGMLLYGHELDGVVAVLRDAGQDVDAEFLVCAHALLLLGHADVRLVYQQRARVGTEARGLEFIRGLGGVYLGREYLCVGVLHHARGVCRDAVALAAAPVHAHLVQVAVMDHVGGELALPRAVLKAGQGITLVALPVAEVAYQDHLLGVGQIVAEHPRAVRLAVKSVVFISVGEFGQTAVGGGRKLVEFLYYIVVTSVDGRLVGLQPRVIAKYCKVFLHFYVVFLSYKQFIKFIKFTKLR